MADNAPAIFKRKQSKPSQSSRARPVEDPVAAVPEDGAAQENGDSPSVVASRLRKQQKARQKQKPQLSFGGDDEVSVSGSPQSPILMFIWTCERSRKETVRWSRSRNLTSAGKSRSLKSDHLLCALNSIPLLRIPSQG